jgi:hypothetical protein
VERKKKTQDLPFTSLLPFLSLLLAFCSPNPSSSPSEPFLRRRTVDAYCWKAPILPLLSTRQRCFAPLLDNTSRSGAHNGTSLLNCSRSKVSRVVSHSLSWTEFHVTSHFHDASNVSFSLSSALGFSFFHKH